MSGKRSATIAALTVLAGLLAIGLGTRFESPMIGSLIFVGGMLRVFSVRDDPQLIRDGLFLILMGVAVTATVVGATRSGWLRPG